MRRTLLVSVLVTASSLFGGLGKGSVPDSKTSDQAVYARRGTLGANDYVVTNVYPCASTYLLHNVENGVLRDRAVNSASVDVDQARFTIPQVNYPRPYARGFMLVVSSNRRTELTIEGASKLHASDGSTALPVVNQETKILSFIEIRTNEFLVEMRNLTEMRKDN